MAGRKRKPTHLHLVDGTHRKDRHGDPASEVQAEPAKGLEAPGYIDENARRVWAELIPQLEGLGVLARVDRHTVACFCIAVSTVEAAERKIDELGITVETFNEAGQLTGIKKNPAVTVRDAALREVRAYAAEFGLSAASRARLTVGPRIPRGSDGKTPGHGKAATASRLLD